MDGGQPINDNRRLEHGVLDPDRKLVREVMRELCDQLKADQIDRKVIAAAMLDEIFKMLDGNPFRTGGDEGAVTADMHFLWDLKHRVVPMVTAWEQGWDRLQREKRPTFRFNRAAPKPVPAPAPRRQAPPADYQASLHAGDLRLLCLRPGLEYTEQEVLTRYRRRVLRALEKRHIAGQDRVKNLAAAKKRVLGWIRRSKGKVLNFETA